LIDELLKAVEKASKIIDGDTARMMTAGNHACSVIIALPAVTEFIVE